MKVAVTGGTGCLGTPLIDKLLESGLEISLLALPDDRLAEQLEEGVQVITGDLSSKDVLTKLTKNCDVVFHLAGKVHSIPKTLNEKDEFYRDNVDGTRNLVQACETNRVNRLIFFSTVGVYGKEGNFHGDEESSCKPASMYAKSKLLAEQIILDSAENGGPQGVVLRFPIAYGPLDRGNMLRLIRVIDQKRFFYFGDGRCFRSMISSVNAAEAAFKAAFASFQRNEVFCVTDGNDWQLLEVVEAICSALCTQWKPSHIPIYAAKCLGKMGDLFKRTNWIKFPVCSSTVDKLSSSFTFSCEKANKILGYKPVESLLEGIAREVEWYKINK